MGKKDNGLFNFPVNSRGKQERTSFEKGGKVEKASSKVEYSKSNPGDTTKKIKTKKKKKPYYKSPEWEMKKSRFKYKAKGFSEKEIDDMIG